MQKNKSKKNTLKKEKMLVCILAVSLIIIGVLYVINYFNQQSLKNNFNTISIDMNYIEKAIAEEIPSISTDKTAYCYRDNFKFEEGPLRCAMKLNITNIKSTETIKVENLIVSNTIWREVEKPVSNLFPTHTGIYENIKTKVKCRADYSIEDSDKSNETFSLKIICSKPSNKKLYPHRTS